MPDALAEHQDLDRYRYTQPAHRQGRGVTLGLMTTIPVATALL
ncbi:hypothetical protein [Arthrobacter sp. NPDC092385]